MTTATTTARLTPSEAKTLRILDGKLWGREIEFEEQAWLRGLKWKGIKWATENGVLKVDHNSYHEI